MWRAVVQRLMAVMLVALACGAGGFVYAHDPQRDRLEVSLERPVVTEQLVGGTVREAAGGRIRIEGEGGTREFTLGGGAPVEELRALAPAALGVGTKLNVGAERSDFGTALSGIVAVGR